MVDKLTTNTVSNKQHSWLLNAIPQKYRIQFVSIRVDFWEPSCKLGTIEVDKTKTKLTLVSLLNHLYLEELEVEEKQDPYWK